jgi:hypothetical protein
MRKALLLLPLLALAACQTPREACISNARADLNVINGLIAETEANLARGYGIEQRQEIVDTQDICTQRNEDGSETRYVCESQDIITIERPVTLDLVAEQRKLDQLRAQQTRLQSQVQQTIQACIAAYPDE